MSGSVDAACAPFSLPSLALQGAVINTDTVVAALSPSTTRARSAAR